MKTISILFFLSLINMYYFIFLQSGTEKQQTISIFISIIFGSVLIGKSIFDYLRGNWNDNR